LAQKEIYTIFSVESNVIMNPRTLKPYVQLEEMDIDLD
jgi:iron complex transport system ATP-binding protein